MWENKQTRNWLLFNIGCFIVMFLVIPPKKGPRISSYGFYLGFVHAIILNWFAVKTYKLWELPGDGLCRGIPLLTSISWIPPAIVFAYYYPYGRQLWAKISYILLFASGTAIVQYIQGIIGMWESKNWKPIYTLPLAICTLSIMSLALPFFNLEDIREN